MGYLNNRLENPAFATQVFFPVGTSFELKMGPRKSLHIRAGIWRSFIIFA